MINSGKRDGEEVDREIEYSFFNSLGLIPSHPLALVTSRELRTRKTSNSLIQISLRVVDGISISLNGGNWNELLVNTE